MAFKRLTVASHRLSSALRFLVISTFSWVEVEAVAFVVVGGTGEDAAASVDKVAMAVADGDDMMAGDVLLMIDRERDLRGLGVGIASREAGKMRPRLRWPRAGQLPSSVPTHLAFCRYLSFLQ